MVRNRLSFVAESGGAAMVPQWVIELVGESRSAALPIIAVYFGYRLGCRMLAPITIASFVALVGSKERSERALKLVELLSEKTPEESEGPPKLPGRPSGGSASPSRGSARPR
ncbi:hypothetical protein Ate02nite_00290 [Paractinoplanes tereljensis]|uniref:Uncharacterized protein n=1 Tax=Paractinoplanes tereljensis TaxID=571912 RepID=A0A919TPP1_9ACTN|nr:hypothetical protein Ate02nite_00290 [Actinoplanes tereljensis]